MSVRLLDNAVHVWYAIQPESWSLPEGVLSDEEQARVARFVHEKSQLAKAFSLYVRRCVLARYLDVSPPSLCFGVAEHGKPFLECTSSIQFNVSDTQDITVLAISLDRELGVDVERYDRSVEKPGLAKHVLSSEEMEYWQHLSEPEASDYVLRAWVAKEAYVKYLGKGLFSNMTDVTLFGGDPKTLYPPHNASMQWLSLHDDYLSALCVQGRVDEVLLREWKLDHT